jgi:hypothetical protein
MYQMVIKYPKCQSNIPNDRKIYPNWDLWFENKPSGNPDLHSLPPNFVVFLPDEIHRL